MDMLHYLNVAIGFTLAMMVLATLIGTTTAVWLAAIQSKVRNLQNGLQQVLSALGDSLTNDEQLEIAKRILRGKMTAGWSPVRWLGFGATQAVGRGEFVILLLRAAATAPGSKLGAVIQGITGQPPETTLRAVERAILDQESATPSAPANVWRTRALALEAPELAARLFSQFDDVIARADDNTSYSRKFTSTVLALAFLIIFPVNSFDVLSRLTNDKAIAASIAKLASSSSDPVAASPVKSAVTGNDPIATSLAKPAATGNEPAAASPVKSIAPGSDSNASPAKPAATGNNADKLLEAIDKQGLFGDVFSDDGAHITLIKEARKKDGLGAAVKIAVKESLSEPGVWTTFILVSLGAPFWQGLLDKLLGLRSKITAKTEEERAQRAAQNPTIA